MSALTAQRVLREVGKHPGRVAREIAIRRLRVVAAREGLFGTTADAEEEQARIDVLEEALSAIGRCKRCGRTLTDPESVSRGIGPDCWANDRKRAREGSPARQEATTP